MELNETIQVHLSFNLSTGLPRIIFYLLFMSQANAKFCVWIQICVGSQENCKTLTLFYHDLGLNPFFVLQSILNPTIVSMFESLNTKYRTWTISCCQRLQCTLNNCWPDHIRFKKDTWYSWEKNSTTNITGLWPSFKLSRCGARSKTVWRQARAASLHRQVRTLDWATLAHEVWVKENNNHGDVIVEMATHSSLYFLQVRVPHFPFLCCFLQCNFH